MRDEQFNFKSLIKIDCKTWEHLEDFYHASRLLRSKERDALESLPLDLDSVMKNVELMFKRIDIKTNVFKSEKEKSIEQLKPFVDQIKLEPVEEKLNQTRREMIDELKEIHDESINEMNALCNKFKQPIYWSTKSERENSMKEARQCAEKINRGQAKLPISSYSKLPGLSHFFVLSYSNAFKGVKLVKYFVLMDKLLCVLYGEMQTKFALPINKKKILFISAPNKSSANCTFQAFDFYTGLAAKSVSFVDDPRDILSINPVIETFLIVDEHVVTLREFVASSDIKSDEFLSKFSADRLQESFTIKCFNQSEIKQPMCIHLIDIFDANLNVISQATIKCMPHEAYVFTCGNGILIQSIRKTKKLNSHCFELYSLKMKLKQKRIKVDLIRDDSTYIEFKPIKFDDQKCLIYKKRSLECLASIMIYRFSDSTLLQEISICMPLQTMLNTTMAVDSENKHLYFLCDVAKTINCFNLQTRELLTSQIPGMTFTKLAMSNEERLILSSAEATQSFLYKLEDNL